jgi:uncharacterized membrane protein
VRSAVETIAVMLACVAPPAVAADGGPVRGAYAESRAGVAYIAPCGAGKRLELVDSPGARELRRVFATLDGARVRYIFVEVIGSREGDAFRADRVVRAQAGGLGCSEDLRHVTAKAGGNDPSWSLVFDENALRFQRIGDRAAAAFPPRGSFAERAGRREFTGETDAARIAVVLIRAPCEDKLANALFPYRAEVTFGRRGEPGTNVYRGCAYLGDAAR